MMELPENVLEKLKDAEGDVAVCKILAESGIDPEEFEKTLPASVLEQVNGGAPASTGSPTVVCPLCGNDNPNEISKQTLASILICHTGMFQYRCCKCDYYFKAPWS